MADSNSDKAVNVSDSIDIESTHQGGSNDTMEVEDEAELMMIDTPRCHGWLPFVCVSVCRVKPTTHHSVCEVPIEIIPLLRARGAREEDAGIWIDSFDPEAQLSLDVLTNVAQIKEESRCCTK